MNKKTVIIAIIAYVAFCSKVTIVFEGGREANFVERLIFTPSAIVVCTQYLLVGKATIKKDATP